MNNMYTLSAYKRNISGNKGKKIFEIGYDTKEEAEASKTTLISLKSLKNINKAKQKNSQITVPCDIEVNSKGEKEVKFENYIFETDKRN